ncbi:MAG: sulfatase-like hydrolase/transferase [Acidobacteriaceae bacterium]
MNRREFVATLSSGVAAFGFDGKLTSGASAAIESELAAARALRQNRKTNIILMICDDLGYGDLGCYGSKLPTPHLDAMAAHGAQFIHWNSAHPICSASRAALLTGRYGTRMNTTGAFGSQSPKGTALDETLMSNLFHDKGYVTKAIGKWHLGFPPPYLPTRRGFDSYLGVPWSVDMAPLPLVRDEQIIKPNADRDTLTPLYTEEAVRFLEDPQREKQPFFLYMAFSYPHDPPRASARFADKTGFGHQGDAIAEIDWSVGQVMQTVEKQGLAEDTLILFTSDHGPWYQGSPGALRGRKASTWEGGFRVPMLAKWPGRISPGRKVDAWCSHLDLLPTFATFCGLSLPEKPLDGVELSRVFLEHQEKVERKPLLYFSPMGNRGLDIHCIRRDQWKVRVAQAIKGEIYINDRTTGAEGSAWLARPELYNLEQDPLESYDIAHLHPNIVAELVKNLEEQMASFPPSVTSAYAALKKNEGDISTPPSASPRPYDLTLETDRPWSWEPPDRRWSSLREK